jgi:anaerobic selenocysteine-containing dehydrogenase
VHPQTANALGVADSDPVNVTGTNGATLRDIAVRVDERVPQGAVALVEGLVEAPLNALGAAPAVRLEKALVTA